MATYPSCPLQVVRHNNKNNDDNVHGLYNHVAYGGRETTTRWRVTDPATRISLTVQSGRFDSAIQFISSWLVRTVTFRVCLCTDRLDVLHPILLVTGTNTSLHIACSSCYSRAELLFLGAPSTPSCACCVGSVLIHEHSVISCCKLANDIAAFCEKHMGAFHQQQKRKSTDTD